MEKYGIYFLWGSIIVFAASLTQPAYYQENEKSMPGFLALTTGALGVFYGGACLSWLANPFLLLSWIIWKNVWYSLIFNISAVICACSFLLFDNIIANEAGKYKKITGYGTGYWLWLSSTGIMLFGNVIRLKI